VPHSAKNLSATTSLPSASYRAKALLSASQQGTRQRKYIFFEKSLPSASHKALDKEKYFFLNSLPSIWQQGTRQRK